MLARIGTSASFDQNGLIASKLGEELKNNDMKMKQKSKKIKK